MDKDHLAYLGAKQRQKEIAEETAALEKFIRDYEKRTGARNLRNVHAVPSGDETVRRTRRILVDQQKEQRRRRRRKPMSAAQKKAVSARMRKYWAARRETQGSKKR